MANAATRTNAASPTNASTPTNAASPRRAGTPSAVTTPSGPFGTGGLGGNASGDGGGIASASDPLSANGFSSALCRSGPPDLSTRTRANCATSGLSVSPVPIDHYWFDIHIDTPFPGIGGDTVAIVIQDVLLTPIWTALVWLIHALIVALEWCYAIDLLDSRTIGGVSRSLGQAERLFTGPWMVVVLAIAAVAVAYRGLVRRRVADSLGDVAMMAAMMLAGLALIASPRESVGRLSALVNEASLGTLAAVTSGDPRQPDQSLADGLQAVFDSSVQGPWCYLEFGNVTWCRSPGRLDRRLLAAAQKLAAADRQGLSCQPSSLTPCRGQSPKQADLAREASLVSSARTNGAMFLAFPANGPARNAINDSGSLLHTLCGTYDATACSAPTAAQAEFRTASGTWPRAGGLLFIGVGVVGMLALLAFICLRLIGAALLSVFFLLLAPVAVLTPALGDSGRAVFRSWLTRLLGALFAKLIYSVFLGVVLLMVGLLQGMGSLGWWTQWLLIAAFWWTVFNHRHRVYEVATLGHRDMADRGVRFVRHPLAGGLVRPIARRSGGRPWRWPRIPGPPETPPQPWPKLPPPTIPSPRPPDPRTGPDQPRYPGPAGPRTSGPGADPGRALAWLRPPGGGDERAQWLEPGVSGSARAQQLQRLLTGDRQEAHARASATNTTAADARRARLARLRDQEARARRHGDVRRAALLATRAQRLDVPGRAGRGTPTLARASSDQRLDAERFLQRQAALRRGVAPGPRANPGAY
ncbi:MAG TPA: hypothetical protein VGY97_08940, partial [Solirubrobacteraceae bacterium]|nr:hypothetical protein [Solirubrobacteraceae bacterium]